LAIRKRAGCVKFDISVAQLAKNTNGAKVRFYWLFSLEIGFVK